MMTRLRSIVQHNLPAKIAALIVAVVLWLYVMNDQNPAIDGSYTVPVTIENAPEGYQMNAAADTVTIRVRGPRSLFVAAGRSDFHARMNLADFIEGEKAYTVEPSIPYGFELVSITPDKINVTLDRLIQKTFKAELTVGGSPASGFTVDKISQTDTAATAAGPRSLVDQVAHIVGHINLSGQSADYTATVPYYTGHPMYALATREEIAARAPKAMSWNSKNVMPFLPLDELPQDRTVYLVVERHAFATFDETMADGRWELLGTMPTEGREKLRVYRRVP